MLVEHKYKEHLDNNGKFIIVKAESCLNNDEENYTISIDDTHFKFTSYKDLLSFKEMVNRAIFNILISK